MGYILQNIKVANNLFLTSHFTFAFELEAKKAVCGGDNISQTNSHIEEILKRDDSGASVVVGGRGRKQRRRDATGAPPHNPRL